MFWPGTLRNTGENSNWRNVLGSASKPWRDVTGINSFSATSPAGLVFWPGTLRNIGENSTWRNVLGSASKPWRDVAGKKCITGRGFITTLLKFKMYQLKTCLEKDKLIVKILRQHNPGWGMVYVNFGTCFPFGTINVITVPW